MDVSGPAPDEWIRPPKPAPLTGEERFIGLDATTRDFWSFALSDLLMNNARGYLAEYLVARAVGAKRVAGRVGRLRRTHLRRDRRESRSAGYPRPARPSRPSRAPDELIGRPWPGRE